MSTTPGRILTASPTLPEDKVPFGTKVAFGAANMVGLLTSNLAMGANGLVTPVFVVALGLSPAFVGVAMVIFRIYDAVTDLIMGWISDNTRTRWGRRRPYLLLGAVLCALVLPLIWMVSREWSNTAQMAWLIGAGIVLYTCTTIYGVPYESFSLELTPDYKERTSVASYKLVISSLAGLLVGWSWYITQLPIFNDPLTGKPDILIGARALSVVAGVGVLLFGLAPVFFARERYYASASKQAKVSLWSNCGAVMRNRAFLILASFGVCAVTGSFLTEGIGFYTNLYYVCQGDQVLAAKITGARAVMWMPASIAAVFFFQFIGNRWSKTHALALALVFMLLSIVCRWWILRPDLPYLSLASSFALCLGITGMWQILPAMNADVVDSDELKTSLRREGSFASIFSWFMKLSFTVGLGLPGIIVEWTHLEVTKGATQAAGVITALRFWDIILPSTLVALAIGLLMLYPLSVSRMAEIRRELETRRGRL